MLMQDIAAMTLSNGVVEVGLTNIGASIMSIRTPDRRGIIRNIVAGYARPEEYLDNPWYFGCTVGRVVNRIGGATFKLDGREIRVTQNHGAHHLHGGLDGLHRQVWKMTGRMQERGADSVAFEYLSLDGAEGYPGNLRVRVEYMLDATGRLKIGYSAVTDRRTPLNLSNHSYFNLTGFDHPCIDDHLLTVNADAYTEKSDQNLPTGRILPVRGTALDLRGGDLHGKGMETGVPATMADRRSMVRLGDRIGAFPLDKGFDHNFVLREGNVAAELYEPAGGRVLRILTDRPGIQVYTANWWDGSVTGEQGRPYVQHGGVALETQAFPDSVNRKEFPSIILSPGETYKACTIFEFDIK